MTRHLRRAVAAVGVSLGIVPAAFAQQATTISGNVTSEAKAPIQAVSVSIQSLGVGSYTDAQGHYSFTVPASRVTGQSVQITARRIGYGVKTVTITLSGAAITQDFELANAATQLEGVVVSALGAERPKSQLGSAVTQLNTEELNAATPQQNIMQQVEGKVAGVRITSPGTQGGSVNIIIRGQNSLTGSNQPLFVVDGIPVSSSSKGGSVGSGHDYGSAISDINPEDIESMTVLKGPNAAALYGSRASNGVILLTTKKGRASGGRIRTDLSTSLTYETPGRFWDFQNQYGQGSGGSFSFVDGNGHGDCDGCDQSYGPKLNSGLMIHQFTDGPDTSVKSPWVSHSDNVRSFFNTGRTLSTTGSVSGGTDRVSGRASFGYDDINGVVPFNRFTKFNTSLSGQFQANDRLSANATAQYVRNNGMDVPGVGYNNSSLEQFFWFGRQVDMDALRNYKQGSIANSVVAGREYNWNYNFHSNPFWEQAENPANTGRDRIIGSVAANYKLADGVNATLRTGSDIYRFNINTKSAYAGPGASPSYNGAMSLESDYFNENNTDLFVNGTRSLGHGFTLNATAGGNMRRSQTTIESQSTNSLLVPGLYNISNSAIAPTVSSSLSRRETNSLYGSAAFTYNNWWTVEGTARNDWSSTLPKGANSYFYPSINTSVVLTDAIPSLKNSVLDFAKLRGSFAKVGNDASPYQLATVFSGVSAKFNGQPQYQLGDALANANLKPELTKSIEYGAEVGLYDNRVTVDATVYSNQTRNQILSATVSAASGFTTKAINAGRIDNHGYEAALNLIPLRMSNGFEWNTAFNFAHNRSNVVQLTEGIPQFTLGNGLFADARTVAAVGQPYGQIQVRGYMRDSVTGAIMTSGGKPLGTTNYLPMGNIQPKWTGGWGNTFKYGSWTVGGLLDIRRGGNIVSYTNSVGDESGVLASSLKGREVDWDNPGLVVRGTDRESCGAGSHVGTNGMYVCVGGGQANTKNIVSEVYFQSLFQNMEPYVYDASYVKLREVRIGYDLPQRLAARLNASAVNIALVGRNLGLWTNVPNVDPEFAFSDGNAQGIEYGVVPNARSIGFNLRITP